MTDACCIRNKLKKKRLLKQPVPPNETKEVKTKEKYNNEKIGTKEENKKKKKKKRGKDENQKKKGKRKKIGISVFTQVIDLLLLNF